MTVSSFVIYYASKVHLKITRVQMLSEQDAWHWYRQCLTWTDVVRARIVAAGGEVLDDQIVESRMIDDDQDLEAACRELAARMDGVFVADRSLQSHATRAAEARRLTLDPSSSDVCWCGHTKIVHAGADSNGRCQSECKCQRFIRARQR